MALSPGEMLSDNLELERELGSGGMGAVWVARNTSLGVRVAVKVLKGGDAGPELRARFEREARGLAALDHPNLVRIFDFGLTMDGEPYIVMELLNGEDLAQRVTRGGPLAPQALVHIVTQTCEALHHAHAQGVVHRDIKPANLFLAERDGQVVVKVVDFGVAKFAAGDLSQTQTGMVLGTPYYMSPEQFLSPRSIDGRSDLWSLGVVVYAALTGTLPFQGETMTAIGMAASAGRFVPPSQRRLGLPAAVDAWMARVLCPQLDRRVATARELATSFAEAVAGASTGASANSSEAAALANSSAAAPAITAGTAARRGGATVVMTAGAMSPGAMPAAAPPSAAPHSLAPSAAPGAPMASASPLAASVAHSPIIAKSTLEPHAPAKPKSRGFAIGGVVAGALAVAAVAGVLLMQKSPPEPDEEPEGAPVKRKSASALATVSAATEPSASASSSAVVAPPPTAAPSESATAPPSATATDTTTATPIASAPPPLVASANPTAPTSMATAAATTATAPASAATPKRSSGAAQSTTIKCWKDNEGSKAGTKASSASVSIPISETGKSGNPKIMPASSAPAFVSCAVSRLSSMQYGPGAAETMAFSVSLPAAK
ncbi:MAG: serine/threonine protein kinase [Polyangiaceae bacterium]|nr:serine/threonine protein kinase [Polyangiaceae bacterium]